MFNLTHQERLVILFLSAVALVGIGAGHFLKKIPHHKIAVGTGAHQKLNINQANTEELIAVPGIGRELARRIMEYRRAYGSFVFAEDIKKVKGIGPEKFRKIKDYLVIE